MDMTGDAAGLAMPDDGTGMKMPHALHPDLPVAGSWQSGSARSMHPVIFGPKAQGRGHRLAFITGAIPDLSVLS
jgi:hypothetical protein